MNSPSTLRTAVLTLTLAVAAGSACGGTTTPEPDDDWQTTACNIGLISGEDQCNSTGNAGAGGGGGMGTGGTETMAGGGGGGGTGPVPVCDAVTTVFKASSGGCVGGFCHNADSPNGGFVDEDPMNFVGLASASKGADCLLINPDNVEASMIYTRAVGGSPECGAEDMPLGNPGLDQTQQECLLDWLSQFSNNPEPGPVAGGGAGGGGGGGTDEPCDAVAEVFSLPGAQGGCGDANCHVGAFTFGGFADGDPASFVDKATLSGGCSYIDSSNPEGSAIYARLQGGSGDCGGTTMPLNGPAPSAEQKACVLSWLSQF